MRTLTLPSFLLAATVLVAGTLGSTEARAESDRQGLVVGAGVGVGAIVPLDCAGCDNLGGLALNLRVGGVVIPRLVVMYDGQVVISRDAGTVVTSGTHTLAGQVWLTSRFWVRGGLGISVLRLASNNVVFRNEGLGATAAAGFEILKNGNFYMDVQAIYGHSRFEGGGQVSNLSGLIGFNWY